MSARRPRFEIVRGDDGWWARFRAANGRVVWVTETYERRRAAEKAILALGRAAVERDRVFLLSQPEYIELREVDERD